MNKAVMQEVNVVQDMLMQQDNGDFDSHGATMRVIVEVRFVIVNGKEPAHMWKTAAFRMLIGPRNPVLFRLAQQAHQRGTPRKTGLYRE